MASSQGEELVFLLSLPRSGSTILSLLLGAHPDIACPPEPWILLKLHSLRAPGDPENPYNDYLATTASNDFLDEPSFLASARAFGLCAYRGHLERSGKKFFVDKTPRYYHVLPFLDRLFPRARKIWLTRDPLDTALSYRTTWGIGSAEAAGDPCTANSVDFALGLFALAGYFAEPSPYKHSLRYEDLVGAPRQTLEALCRFLALPFEDRMLAYPEDRELIASHEASQFGDRKAVRSSRLDENAVGRWRTGLSADELQALVDTIGFDILERTGYGQSAADLCARGVRPPDEAAAEERRRRIAAAPLSTLAGLYESLRTGEAQRAAAAEAIEGLTASLEQSRCERAAGLDAIRRLDAESEARLAALRRSDAESEARLAALHRSDAESQARLAHIHRLDAELDARLDIIRQLEAERARLEATLEAQQPTLARALLRRLLGISR